MERFAFLPPGTASLRQASRDVPLETITTSAFQTFLDRMIFTMHESNGVGLAAPQIGENIRAVIIQPGLKPECLINPVIVKKSDALAESEEGCFSVPGKFGIVMRHKKVTVQAINRHGRRVELELKNFPAFVVQHEVDHLDGILFIDKATNIVEVTKNPTRSHVR
jgi:peptide deformylase